MTLTDSVGQYGITIKIQNSTTFGCLKGYMLKAESSKILGRHATQEQSHRILDQILASHL